MDKIFDLFVIGGGINGAAIACDAAGRGLAVGLAEMNDFAEGTSSRSSKLIHGGLRYLEACDFRLVREALGEREILMRKAPHLVRPLRLVLPHAAGQRPRWMIRLGLLLYDHLARRKVLPASESIDLGHHPAGTALKPAYRHAFIYSDCHGDDSRLVIANLMAAQSHRAEVFPRHEFISAIPDGEIWRISLRLPGADKELEFQSNALVNVTGPWVIHVSGRIAGVAVNRRLRMVRGSHIVVPRLWEGEHGYFLQTSDHRTMEVFPWERNFTLIGTTDEPWEDDPGKVSISDKEIDYMLAEANVYLRKPVTKDQIIWSYSGVRPLFEVGSSRDAGLSSLTRDYSFEIDRPNGGAPVLTVFGGKLTTHRRLAEHAMQELSRIMHWPEHGITRTEILPGGDFGSGGMPGFERDLKMRFPWLPAAQASRYVRQFGTRASELLDGARRLEDLGACFGADLYEREVDFLTRTEWARTAEDVLWRRSKLGLRLSPAQIERLCDYLASAARC